MEQYVIKGGNPLVGEVEISGAKNAALAILAAAIMTDETVTIDNLPDVRDINALLQAMGDIGAKIDRIFAPMLFRKLATSTTWGSFAAFSMVVFPSAMAAAIIILMVAPTDTLSK